MHEAGTPPTSPQHVPYLAYKPKRHSRNLSTASRPSSLLLSPAASPALRLPADDDEKDPVPSFSLAGAYGTPPKSGPSGLTSLSPSPAIRIDLVPDTTVDSAPSTPISPRAEQHEAPKTSSRPDGLPAQPLGDPTPGTTMSSPRSNPSPLTAPDQSTHPPVASTSKPKKTTTFRRLAPSRPSSAAPQAPTAHSRNVSVSSLPPSPSAISASPIQRSLLDERPRTTSLMTQGIRTPTSPLKALPLLPADLAQSNDSASSIPARLDSVSRTTSVMTQSTITPSTSRASSTVPAPQTETNVSSRVTSPAPGIKPKAAPYRPGFQPKGVYRPRTDEYLEIRRSKRDGEGEEGRLMRIERTKLERRLEKLIALHFPPPKAEVEAKGEPLVAGPRKGKRASPEPIARRASSFFDLDKMRTLKLNDPGDLWRGVMGKDAGAKEDIRASEQRITPWEEDSTVSKCPLCAASFHPLTNRKHHCRLCGKIICSLPPKSPQRPLKCSLLFFVDSKTRQIEEVGEGVDYGVKRQNRTEGEDKFLKSVRICRDCRPVILRQQYSQQVEEIPIFFKLYDVFINLEKEIEDALPQFQELLLSLNHNDQPTKEASSARKRLLEAFAQYDKLAKQIRSIPCPNGPGSSQDRIQASILSRANLFLQKNMFPLQSLPRLTAKPKANGSKANGNAAEDDLAIDPDSELALALQPLLEQEALLESFIDEAKAQRKFEDVKTLKSNQNEIRREIERMLDEADQRASGATSKGRKPQRS